MVRNVKCAVCGEAGYGMGALYHSTKAVASFLKQILKKLGA